MTMNLDFIKQMLGLNTIDVEEYSTSGSATSNVLKTFLDNQDDVADYHARDLFVLLLETDLMKSALGNDTTKQILSMLPFANEKEEGSIYEKLATQANLNSDKRGGSGGGSIAVTTTTIATDMLSPKASTQSTTVTEPAEKPIKQSQSVSSKTEVQKEIIENEPLTEDDEVSYNDTPEESITSNNPNDTTIEDEMEEDPIQIESVDDAESSNEEDDIVLFDSEPLSNSDTKNENNEQPAVVSSTASKGKRLGRPISN